MKDHAIMGSTIGLAAHYGRSAVKAIRIGQERNAEHLARLAAHHQMNVRGNANNHPAVLRLKRAGIKVTVGYRDPGGVCGCEYGELPKNFGMTRTAEGAR